MTRRFYKTILDLHTVPLILLSICAVISAALILALFAFNWTIWLVGLLLLAAWSPVVIYKMRELYQGYGWLALLFLLVVSQTAHFFEHMSQMVEIHILGLQGRQAA